MSALEAPLLAAHAAEDKAALIDLYRQAATQADGPDQAGFFLTQAYVYALDAGHPAAEALRAELIALGREEPLGPPPVSQAQDPSTLDRQR